MILDWLCGVVIGTVTVVCMDVVRTAKRDITWIRFVLLGFCVMAVAMAVALTTGDLTAWFIQGASLSSGAILWAELALGVRPADPWERGAALCWLAVAAAFAVYGFGALAVQD